MSGKQVPPDLEAAWQSFQQQSNKPATKKTSSKKREIKLEDTPLELNAVDHAVNNATIQLQPQMEAREALIAKKARVEGEEEEAIVPFRRPVTREQYQIISMEAHNRRDNQVELFEHNINKYHT